MRQRPIIPLAFVPAFVLLAVLLWPRPASVSADPLTGVAAVAAGGYHNCAVTTAGALKCWGGNYYGELGDATTANRTTPVDVVGVGSGAAAVAAGSHHTCALTTAGAVKCWGANELGQLGDGTSNDRLTPVEVVGLGSGVARVSGGVRAPHTCVVTTGGGVKCWGFNFSGQLGDGTTTGRTSPVDVVGLGSGVAAVAAGGYYTCGLTTAGGVKCWGSNGTGQLGDGTTNDSLTPVDVVGLGSGVVAIAVGGYHSCALTTAGAVKCWGSNWAGQLGDGSTTNATAAVDVTGLDGGVVAVAAGAFHTCVVTTAGAVNCWGANDDGRLGDGTTTGRTTPVYVVGLGSSVAAVAAGEYQTCALTTAGGVKCWGYNGSGQLGDGTTNDSLTPVNVVAAPPTATPTPTPTRTPGPTPTAAPFEPTFVETIDEVAPADPFILPSDDDCPVGAKCKTLFDLFIPDGQPDYTNWALRIYTPFTHFSFAYDAIVPDGAIVARVSGYARYGPIGDCSSGAIESWDYTIVDATTNSATTTGSPTDLSSFDHWPTQLDTLRDQVLSENPGAVLQARWAATAEGTLNVLFFRLSDGTHAMIAGMGDPTAEPLFERCGPDATKVLTLGETLDNPDTPQDEGGIPLGACTDAGTESFWVSIDRNDTPPGDFVTLFDTSTCSSNTPAGTDVTVPLLGGTGSTAGLEVTFSEVTESGSTSVTGSTAGEAPPTGFVVRGLSGESFYYDVNTTSTFSPPLVICINYDDTGLNASQEESLALMQNHDGELVDRTTSIDTVGNVICGTAPGLSTWAVMQPSAAVGGIAELPVLPAASAEEVGPPTGGSGWSAGNYAALAGGLAAAVLATAAAASYARRRRLR